MSKQAELKKNKDAQPSVSEKPEKDIIEKMSIDSDWICRPCGEKHGRWRGLPHDVETFHYNVCAYCLKPNQFVCHRRRYGYPKNPNIRDTEK